MDIRIDRAEKNVLEQICSGAQSIDALVRATGFPRQRLRIYLDRLERDGFIELTADRFGDISVDVTEEGRRRGNQPRVRHPLAYV